MFNWKALSKNELKKELEAFGRKDLKKLRIMLEEIEAEKRFAWETYMDVEDEEEDKKWDKIWSRMDDKWEIVRKRIVELESRKDRESL